MSDISSWRLFDLEQNRSGWSNFDFHVVRTWKSHRQFTISMSLLIILITKLVMQYNDFQKYLFKTLILISIFDFFVFGWFFIIHIQRCGWCCCCSSNDSQRYCHLFRLRRHNIGEYHGTIAWPFSATYHSARKSRCGNCNNALKQSCQKLYTK